MALSITSSKTCLPVTNATLCNSPSDENASRLRRRAETLSAYVSDVSAHTKDTPYPASSIVPSRNNKFCASSEAINASTSLCAGTHSRSFCNNWSTVRLCWRK